MSTSNPERSKVLWLGAPPHLEHDVELANRGLNMCGVGVSELECSLVICATPLRVRTIQGPERPYEEAA